MCVTCFVAKIAMYLLYSVSDSESGPLLSPTWTSTARQQQEHTETIEIKIK